MWTRIIPRTALLAVGALMACSNDTPTGPTPTPLLSEEPPALVEVRYEAQCALKYHELAAPDANFQGTRVVGSGTCKVVYPFGPATIVFEGVELENEGGYVIEGQLIYRFGNGTRLVSVARMTGSEAGIESRAPMQFEQKFLRGTGRLLGVRGGNGTGRGLMFEPAYEARYVATGTILMAPPED